MLNLLKFVANHPFNSDSKVAALSIFAKWQVSSLFNTYPIIYPFTERSKLIIQKGLAGATQNMYCGLHEFEDMGFLLHLLRPEDLFVDIGANVGSYTILAAGEIGAQSITIEPIPETFQHLTNNILINQLQDRVNLLNIGVSGDKGTIKFTRSFDAMNHVATAGESDTIDIPTDTLDNLLGNKKPVLLKIDVEGFETEVLKGAKQMLSKESLKAVIIELNGLGRRYGYDEQSIHDSFLRQGFTPCQYNPFKRELIKVEGFGTHNTIYVRDLSFVQQRVTTARKVNIRNRAI